MIAGCQSLSTLYCTSKYDISKRIYFTCGNNPKKADSVSDGSETQAPEVSTGSHRHQVPDQRNHTPSSMPPPAAPGRRHGGGRGGGCTPEDSSTQRSCSNESYATPPIPKPSAR